MSDENEGTLMESIDKATIDLTGVQRQRYIDWLKTTMPGYLAEGREEIFKAGRSEQEEALYQKYQAELPSIKQGDFRALARLKKRYRARGLQIW